MNLAWENPGVDYHCQFAVASGSIAQKGNPATEILPAAFPAIYSGQPVLTESDKTAQSYHILSDF